MIGELVSLLLSILIRFLPLAETQPIYLKSPRQAGEFPSFAIWIPMLGWIAVSVRRAAFGNEWRHRVESTRWLGRYAPDSVHASCSQLLNGEDRNRQAFLSRFWRRMKSWGAFFAPDVKNSHHDGNR